MTTGAKPNHKAAFAALHTGLAPTFLAARLAPHPVWQPGWDKDNAHYSAAYLAPPASDGIRTVTLVYGPAYKGWHIIGVFHPCPDAAERLANAAPGATWADCLSGLPHRQSDLVPWKKRLFWRAWVKRQLRFDADGTAVGLDQTLAAILNAWPDFLHALNRPGTM